ncbi:hypothetical protein SISNIDRAFT_486997 [Sistotremastrum niveocremeum HHB9708]|uniref:Uncharacterized protein n=1 Tax=Sistotremastrum niveocremeum HHB9708 TaxID=1314777 RepID=A0A164T475_9AGAM|nr:hypothetical protein SISNIDRAFT_486997 [Sistotremastrum niveocremeum HHB9708]
MDQRQHWPKILKLREIFVHEKGWSTTSGSGVRMVPNIALYERSSISLNLMLGTPSSVCSFPHIILPLKHIATRISVGLAWLIT